MYENGEGYKKITKGEHTEIYYIMRIFNKKTNEGYPCHGNMKKIGSQLFGPYALELSEFPGFGAGSYIQVRWDLEDRNTVDIEMITPKGKGRYNAIKPKEYHHQPQNTGSIYLTNFDVGHCNVWLGIGSGVTEEKLRKEFYEKVEKTHPI